MKTRNLLVGIALLAISLSGCKKNNTSNTITDTSLPSTDEAASTISASISGNGYGLSTQITDAVPVSQTGNFGFNSGNANHSNLQASKNVEATGPNKSICGTMKDTIITRSNSDTSKYHYSLYLHYKFQVNCVNNTPSNMVFADSTSGTYVGPRVNSNGSSNTNTTLTFPSGSGDSVVVFNGTYVRNGSTVSKVGNKATFTSKLSISLSNLTIGKVSHIISAGTGTLTLTGTSSTGKSFSYTGTVDFSTKNQLVVNILGVLHHFDLRSGNELPGV